MTTTKTRTATKKDFFKGGTLISSEGYEFVLKETKQDGVWESKDKCHFISEARFYKVYA